MSLDLYFFKKDVDFQDIRNKIDDLHNKLRDIQDEIERHEDKYDNALLSSINITHNLHVMAKEVGLYEVLWHPERKEITSASQMVTPLEKGIEKLEANPDKYKTFNPPNGWGNYEYFVSFCKSVLQKCHEYPDAVVESAG
ncbi:hypothetical protein [Proteiniphilum sp. UBA5510]|uniref:hypothetical protein n=1 Tax=Proteiniphilum sp. UBA5510 TaxID=1947286 RepID=UPI0025811797|nr:hypothetical protein [Proteiniphilum sp. UBA5510]